MNPARQAYATMLREYVSPALRAAGCKGSAGRYRLPSTTHWLLIGFQSSRYSSAAEVPFTVNVSAADRSMWAGYATAMPRVPARPAPNGIVTDCSGIDASGT